MMTPKRENKELKVDLKYSQEENVKIASKNDSLNVKDQRVDSSKQILAETIKIDEKSDVKVKENQLNFKNEFDQVELFSFILFHNLRIIYNFITH